jgi:hypothetical protein
MLCSRHASFNGVCSDLVKLGEMGPGLAQYMAWSDLVLPGQLGLA